LKYIKNITFFDDWNIIFITIKKAIKRDGICYQGMVTAEDFGDYLLRSGKVDETEYQRAQEESRSLIMI
jgi:hypothetical protein